MSQYLRLNLEMGHIKSPKLYYYKLGPVCYVQYVVLYRRHRNLIQDDNCARAWCWIAGTQAFPYFL